MLLAATVACGVARADAAERERLSFSIGADYSSGDYGGTATTSIWYFPATLKLDDGRNIFRLTVPYLVITGPGNVVYSTGQPMLTRRITGVRRTTQSGLGDAVVSGTFNLRQETPSNPLMDITAKVKLATADDDDLGTGENDYAVQLDLARTIGETSVFGSLGYKIIGDTPAINFNDVLYGSIGWDSRLSQETRGGFVLDLQEASIPGGGSQVELSAFVSLRLDVGRQVLGYIARGFADGSPDWRVGVALTFFR